ncbi:MAG: homoserine dehydrogenase [Deltaproteobacteria bacterium]|nr:MAG: homoserine dehydrogenase [Deltaproteobacteria bacterium]
MKTIQVGLIGFGTVGRGLAEVLHTQRQRLIRRSGLDIRLQAVARSSQDALPEPFTDVRLTRDARKLITDPEIDIIVELIGGIEPAKTFLLEAITAGKHVVTANKALLSQEGKAIFSAAAEKGVEVGFEGSVGGGIPVIKAFKEGLAANRILSIMGIMNGTANYILTRMTDEGVSFKEVLNDAQEKGFAEADPTYDVEGIDTAHKLAILMQMAYGMNITHNEIATEGISSIDPVDIEMAREFGCRIKLLAISRNHGSHVEGRVHPTMVPESHLLASINGAYNAFHFTGDMVGDVLLYGPGAGMMATGSAVAADVLDIARNMVNGCVGRVPGLNYVPEEVRERSITSVEDLYCPCYLRLQLQDKPGMLSKVSGVLGEHGISIESMIQKGQEQNGLVPVVMVTHSARESAMQRALDEVTARGVVAAPPVRIRILENDDVA